MMTELILSSWLFKRADLTPHLTRLVTDEVCLGQTKVFKQAFPSFSLSFWSVSSNSNIFARGVWLAGAGVGGGGWAEAGLV